MNIHIQKSESYTQVTEIHLNVGLINDSDKANVLNEH